MTKASALKEKGANLKPDLPSPLNYYIRSASDSIENWGLSFQYYLSRALECLITAGKHRSEISDLHSALTWLKRAQTKPAWKIKFDQALEDWPLDDDLVLALEYILCAANVNGALDYIDSAISCLENRLVYLNEQEMSPLNFDGNQSHDLEGIISSSNSDGGVNEDHL